MPKIPGRGPQPRNSKRKVDDFRPFDLTSLRANHHGRFVHRDYAAHFFRWGFAKRFVDNTTTVLDAGCGPDCALARVLNYPRQSRPAGYLGVDLNDEPRSVPGDKWAEFRWGFDFTRRWRELGEFKLVVSFEVLEHMREADGRRYLTGLAGCVEPGGTLLLSTPVFNGKAAANHLYEWSIIDLARALTSAGLTVSRRHGTFASRHDIMAVASPAEKDLIIALESYYAWEVLSCFIAPLHPDASRNNVWVCQKRNQH